MLAHLLGAEPHANWPAALPLVAICRHADGVEQLGPVLCVPGQPGQPTHIGTFLGAIRPGLVHRDCSHLVDGPPDHFLAQRLQVLGADLQGQVGHACHLQLHVHGVREPRVWHNLGCFWRCWHSLGCPSTEVPPPLRKWAHLTDRGVSTVARLHVGESHGRVGGEVKLNLRSK